MTLRAPCLRSAGCPAEEVGTATSSGSVDAREEGRVGHKERKKRGERGEQEEKVELRERAFAIGFTVYNRNPLKER